MKVYVTSAFSLGMLGADNARIEVSRVDPAVLKDVIDGGADVRIGHQSTADVVGELVGRKLTADRTPVTINPGETAELYVVQILQRPREGQVFTADEIREIISSGRFKVFRVRVTAL